MLDLGAQRLTGTKFKRKFRAMCGYARMIEQAWDSAMEQHRTAIRWQLSEIFTRFCEPQDSAHLMSWLDTQSPGSMSHSTLICIRAKLRAWCWWTPQGRIST